MEVEIPILSHRFTPNCIHVILEETERLNLIVKVKVRSNWTITLAGSTSFIVRFALII